MEEDLDQKPLTLKQRLANLRFPKLPILLVLAVLVVLPVTIKLSQTETKTAVKAETSKPDIIVVMVDDLGSIDSRILDRLPNIKSLWLDGGLTFNSSYNETPLCCPGRASFLSGQHTKTHHVTRNDPRLFNPKYTVATALHDAGYYTIMTGKYFNHPEKLTDFTPPGWDKTAMIMSMDKTDGNPSYFKVQGKNVKAGFVDRFISDKSLTWLSQVPANKPFFMWINPHAPHWGATEARPWAPNIEAKYLNDPRCNNIQPWKPPSYSYGKKPNGFPLDDICKSLLTVDDMVGRLKAQAVAQGRNPIWVFTSDNGMSWGRDGFPLKNVPQATKTPLYFAGPNVIPGVTNALVSNIDLGPTLVALAGTSMPKAAGISYAGILNVASTPTPSLTVTSTSTPTPTPVVTVNPTSTTSPTPSLSPTFAVIQLAPEATTAVGTGRNWMLEHHPLGGYASGPVASSGSWWGVRTLEWHLVEWPKWRGEALYYLASDPWEMRNVASQYPDKVRELKAYGQSVINAQTTASDVAIPEADLVSVDDTE